MADYSTINTGRVRMTYSTFGRQHKLQNRFQGDSTIERDAAVAVMVNVLNAAAPIRRADWAVLSWEWAKEGDTFFLPFSPILTVDDGAVAAVAGQDANVFISFQAISTQGNRGSFSLFGLGIIPQTTSGNAALRDYRIVRGEDANVDAVLDELQAATTIGIDNNPLIWRDYANIGYNAYWQRKSRG